MNSGNIPRDRSGPLPARCQIPASAPKSGLYQLSLERFSRRVTL